MGWRLGDETISLPDRLRRTKSQPLNPDCRFQAWRVEPDADNSQYASMPQPTLGGMLVDRTYRGAVNLRLLGLIGSVVVVLAVAAYGVRSYLQSELLRRALADGTAAFERGQWHDAAVNLGRYLARRPDDAGVLERYAQAQRRSRPLQANNFRQATSAYRKLLRLAPDNQAAWEELVRLYRLSGNFEELGHLADLRRELAPGDPQAALWEAEALLARDRVDDAAARLDELTGEAASPTAEYVEACVLRAQLEAVARQSQRTAIEWLDRALAADPKAVAARVARARLARLQAREAAPADRPALLEAARKDLLDCDEIAIDDPLLQARVADEWIGLGDYERAASAIEKLASVDDRAIEKGYLDQDAFEADRYVLSAKLALLTERADALLPRTEELLASLGDRPTRILVLPAAIEVYSRTGRVELARGLLNEYIDRLKLVDASADQMARVAVMQALLARAENQPYRIISLLEPYAERPNAELLLLRLLTEALRDVNQLARATQLLERILQRRPNDRDALLTLARIHARRGDWTKLLETVDRGVQQAGGDADFALLRFEAEMGLAFERQDAERAAAAARGAEELAATLGARPQVSALKGAAAEIRGDLETAEQEFRSAAEAAAADEEAALQLARFYARHKRVDDAVAAYRKAATALRASVAWVELADLLASNGLRTDARAALESALNDLPLGEREPLVLRLAQLDAAAGDVDSAEQRLTQWSEQNPASTAARAALLDLPSVRGDAAKSQPWIDQLRAIEGERGVRWRYHQADLLLHASDWRRRMDTIAEHLSLCIQTDPDWLAPVLLLGQMYEDAGRPSDAERVYLASLGPRPSAHLVERLVRLYEDSNRFAEARALLARMASRLGAAAVSRRSTEVAVRAGDLSAAIESSQERMTQVGRNPRDLISLARLTFLQTADFDRAAILLDEAEQQGGDPIVLAAARAGLLFDAGRAADARAVLDRLVADHALFEAYRLRATFLFSINDLEGAERDFARLPELVGGDGHVYYGEFLARTGQVDRAIELWQQGLAQHPENDRLRRGLIKARLNRALPDDLQRVGALVDELAQRVPDRAETAWIRIVAAKKLSQPLDAATVQRWIERTLSDRDVAEDTLAGLLRSTQEFGLLDLGDTLTDRALREWPASDELALLAARQRFRTARFEEGLQILYGVLARDATHRAALVELAAAAVASGSVAQLSDVEGRIRAASDRPGASPLLAIPLAQVLHRQGRSADAVELLTGVLGRLAGAEEIAVRAVLADLYSGLKRFDEAAKTLDDAPAEGANDRALRRSRAGLLAMRGDLAGLTAWAQGLPDEPDSGEALLLSADVLLAQARPDALAAARGLYERAAQLLPNDARPRLGLAILLQQTGELDQAERLYRRVIELEPGQAVALNNLAWLLSRDRGKSGEAETLAQRAVQLGPQNADYYDTLGSVLLRLVGRESDALAAFESCARLAPANSALRARALLRVAALQTQAGRLEAARAALDAAAAIDQAVGALSAEERGELARLREQTAPVP